MTTYRYVYTPPALSYQIRSFQVKPFVRNYGDPSENIWPAKPRLSKVTGTDTDRSATCDFLFVFYSNYGPISLPFTR